MVPLVACGTIGYQRILNVSRQPMVPLVETLVTMVPLVVPPFRILPMVPLVILPMVPLASIGSQWYHWPTNCTLGLPMVPIVPLGEPMVPLALPLVQMVLPMVPLDKDKDKEALFNVAYFFKTTLAHKLFWDITSNKYLPSFIFLALPF